MENKEKMRTRIGKLVLTAAFLVIVAFLSAVFSPAKKTEAASNFCNVYVEIINETEGKITGTVGQEISPYYFTITVHKYPDTHEMYAVDGVDPKFQHDYPAGEDVTSWFAGSLQPELSKYRILPNGLRVTVADAIHTGDTSARFKISGTPIMGASWYLPFSCSERFFCSDSFYESLSSADKKKISRTAETSYGIQFDINRNAWTSNGPKYSVEQLKITGTRNQAITQAELTYNLQGGNFLTSLPQGKDVSSWFRTQYYYADRYSIDGDWIYCRLPEGMTVKLKNAVNPGDRSITFVFSGTPVWGSRDCIFFTIPADGLISMSGSPQSECGYTEVNGGDNGDFKYRYMIEGDRNEPEITVDNVHVHGRVGVPIEDDGTNIVTFRLNNCTLAKTLPKGSRELTSSIVDWKSRYVLEKYGVIAEVERFNAGEDYFQIKITGTPTNNRGEDFIIWLMDDYLDVGCRVKSRVNIEADFWFSEPDTEPHAYISTGNITLQQGYSIDQDITLVAGIRLGEDADDTYRYVINGTFKKDDDVSKYFGKISGGGRNGLKFYAAKDMDHPSEMEVYVKGTPAVVGETEIVFSVAGYGGWIRESVLENGAVMRETMEYSMHSDHSYYFNIVSDHSDEIYAYSYSLDPHRKNSGAVSGLSYEELKAAADSVPISIGGTYTNSSVILTEDRVARLEARDTYSLNNINIWLYIPRLGSVGAYKAGSSVGKIVRLKGIRDGEEVDCPIEGYDVFTVNEIEAGAKSGYSLLLNFDFASATTDESFDDIVLEIKDGSNWRRVIMPSGSMYEIVKVVSGATDQDRLICGGLSASIADCSINGVVDSELLDTLGIEVTVSGDAFKSIGKRTDVTSWFDNLPSGLLALTLKDVKAGSNKINIGFFKRTLVGGHTTVTPREASREHIRMTVPFSALSNGGRAKIPGGVVTTDNAEAVFFIYSQEEFSNRGLILFPSQRGIVGTFGSKEENGKTIYSDLSENGSKTFEFDAYVSYENQANPNEMQIKIENRERDAGNGGTFDLITTESKEFYTRRDFDLVVGETAAIGSTCHVKFRLSCPIYATKITSGYLDIYNSPYGENDPKFYITYEIYETLPEEDNIFTDVVNEEEDENQENGENGNGGQGGNGSQGGNGGNQEAGEEPQIWVNGKDDKRNEIYKKTLTKAVSDLKFDLPDDCKAVVSVTGTDVSEVSGAVSSGKGKKSNIAKAAYKAKDGAVVVTAGKTAGTARIWIAAVNKKKAVEASAYFDVVVGVAPKKLYVTKDEVGEAKNAVKSVALSAGDSVTLFANSNGTELSPYARFTWEALKDDDNLVITPSEDTQSAVITVKSAPSDGKVVKASINVINVESLKKVKVSVPISNEVKSVTGLSAEKNLASALEEKLEENLPYSFVCSDGGSTTTDKIKVYTTTSTEEGTGYTLSNNKFKLTQKSKIKNIKVSYKNGEFTLKAGKKTANGTKLRVLVVATHADKTVSVFESGVITIG